MAEDASNTNAPQQSRLNPDNGLSRIARLRAQMERTTSENIREEGKELRQAVEQSLNVILDLTLDGNVRWLSPTWTEVVGTEVDEVKGKPIANVLIDNKEVFAEAVEALRKSDTNSKVIRFSVRMGPKSRLRKQQEDEEESEGKAQEKTSEPQGEDVRVVNLEGQGILVYDRATGEESHVSRATP